MRVGGGDPKTIVSTISNIFQETFRMYIDRKEIHQRRNAHMDQIELFSRFLWFSKKIPQINMMHGSCQLKVAFNFYLTQRKRICFTVGNSSIHLLAEFLTKHDIEKQQWKMRISLIVFHNRIFVNFYWKRLIVELDKRSRILWEM